MRREDKEVPPLYGFHLAPMTQKERDSAYLLLKPGLALLPGDTSPATPFTIIFSPAIACCLNVQYST